MLHIGISALLVSAFATLLLFYFVSHMIRRQKIPPGPFPLPILGNFWHLHSGGHLNNMLKLSEKYGPVFTVYFGSRPNVVVSGYQAVKEILLDHGDAILGRGEIPLFFEIYHRKGMSIINGEPWKQLRNFSVLTLRDFGMGKKTLEEPIQTEAQHMVTYFRNLSQQPLDPCDILICASSNLLAAILMDNRYEYDDQKWLNILHDINRGFSISSSTCGQLYDMFPSLMKRVPGPHQKIFTYFKALENILIEQINSHLETLDAANPRDYMDCFLIRMKQEQMKNIDTPFDIPNLLSTVFDLFIGGAETAAVTLRYGFLILTKYPEIQEKLQLEIEEVIGHTREPSVDDRNNTPYLNAFIHEVQRFSDVLPMGVARRATKDLNFRGYLIPEGMDVLPLLTTVLHDPSQFEKPKEFNLNHFLDENGKFKKHKAFLPFAAGCSHLVDKANLHIKIPVADVAASYIDYMAM
uniref:unspecific monooxygenase n=1 Tax=Leptobrachium leishanense TaxID=445787 RepID=A0A8C5WMJ6_9ANUR